MSISPHSITCGSRCQGLTPHFTLAVDLVVSIKNSLPWPKCSCFWGTHICKVQKLCKWENIPEPSQFLTKHPASTGNDPSLIFASLMGENWILTVTWIFFSWLSVKLNILHFRHFSSLECVSVYVCENCLFINSPPFSKSSLKFFLSVCMGCFYSNRIVMNTGWQRLFSKRFANPFSSSQPFCAISVLILLFFLQALSAFCVLSNRKRILNACYLQVQMLKQVLTSQPVRGTRGARREGLPGELTKNLLSDTESHLEEQTWRKGHGQFLC